MVRNKMLKDEKIMYLCLRSLYSVVMAIILFGPVSVYAKKEYKAVRYNNGKIKYKGYFEGDQPVGDILFYTQEGRLEKKVNYKDSVAYAQFYYPNGTIQAQGKYEYKAKDSTWIYYTSKGKLLFQEFYLSGILEGEAITFHENGKVCEKKNYLRGDKEGDWVQYYPSGQLKTKGNYQNDLLSGLCTYFEPNGDTVAVGHFYKSARNGEWRFYKKGKLDKKEWYNKGQKIKSTKPDILIKESNKKVRKHILDVEDIMPGGSIMDNY